MPDSRTHRTEVVAQLILKLRAAFPFLNGEVIQNTDVDYSSDGLVIDKAKLPALYLLGPIPVRNPMYSSNQKPVERFGEVIPGTDVPSKFRQFTTETAYDLQFRILLLSQSQASFLDAFERVEAYFMNGKKVRADKQPGVPAAGYNEYEIDITTSLSTSLMGNRSNLKQASGMMVVRGVLSSDGEVFHEGGVLSGEPDFDINPR